MSDFTPHLENVFMRKVARVISRHGPSCSADIPDDSVDGRRASNPKRDTLYLEIMNLMEARGLLVFEPASDVPPYLRKSSLVPGWEDKLLRV